MCVRGGGISVPVVLKTTPVTTVPHASPHAEGVSNEEFRAAMSRLAAGVCLITARETPLAADGPRGEDVGMTATAFLSVSLDPPLVLVSVREGSRMDDLLAEQPLWAVSLLADHQLQIAGRFAMKGRISDRLLFADLPCTRGEASGAPLLSGALATLECRTENRVEAGDHTLVIGRVLTAALPSPDGQPLTYFRGRYRHLGQ
ncbi:flavin reductase family protein [Streptomyces sp. NBC_01546]|uniref:flavin reductase family protein n=2 Tax=unclassified Streptomyces TaxID=2593676 RepID=UPI00214BCC69|nr:MULTISPECIES: flavin reductase family protein [unclassified Streptomyces]MCX5012585.1 flavin reductase family protein [Streptomyces sp. NBC_00555]MCX5606552.1 flavin reductase family protein [Streptomyces sp. NBC_00047]UUU40784.1 flavin reductase family protein [Streptomyces sp. NBC_00162]